MNDIPQNTKIRLDEAEAQNIFYASRVAMVLTNPRLDDNPIIYVNRAFERLTGYTSQMAVGRNCRFLQGEDTQKEHVAQLREGIEDGSDVSLTLLNYRADGSSFHNALLISPIEAEDGSGPLFFLGLQREVPKDAGEGVRKTFEDVVSEVQHRVKNHLSMILGMIRLQARESTGAEGFANISRRIESLQLLYEEMSAAQATRNTDDIDLGAYLSRVANAIGAIDGRHGVRLNIDVSPAIIETDTAVRIGLVVSEILTNAMQHAFEGQNTGLVELRVTQTDDGGLRASISDDGVGIPEDINWPQDGSLGGRLVKGLCDGLGATLDVSRGAIGTVVTFEVPRAHKKT